MPSSDSLVSQLTSARDATATNDANHPFRSAFSALLAITVFGLVTAALMRALGMSSTSHGELNIFFYLFSEYEPGALLALLLFCVAARYATLRRPEILDSLRLPESTAAVLEQRRTLLALAALTSVLCFIGWHAVHHAYPFAMDEFGARFQAQLFEKGALSAELPARFRPVVASLAPVFVNYNPADGTWTSAYLPVYGALLTAFEWLGIGGALNALCAAGSLIALASVARRTISERSAPAVAAILLFSSPQFLITSMTGYSMPAHLFFSLVWLMLYTRGSTAAWLALPWWGLLAMGLHQFVPHALFAIPFLARFVLERRFKWAAYIATVYLLASALWLGWLARFAAPGMGSAVAESFGVPGVRQLLAQSASFAMLFSWQALALALAFIVGLRVALRAGQPVFYRDLVVSVAISVGFNFFAVSDQGHGWGHRYAYPVLGNIALLGAIGIAELTRERGASRALNLLAISTALALIVQLPSRLLEVEQMVRPFATARAAIERMPEEVVLVPFETVWYGQDLIRNDPFLQESPHTIRMRRLVAGEGPKPRPGVRILTQDELVSFGLFPTHAN